MPNKNKKSESKLKAKKSTPKVRKLAKYKPVKMPKTPHPKGLFALKLKHGKQLGKSCLFCKKAIKRRSKTGRDPILCAKEACFKKMRCAYRYDWEHDKLKKPLPKKAA